MLEKREADRKWKLNSLTSQISIKTEEKSPLIRDVNILVLRTKNRPRFLRPVLSNSMNLNFT
jgi:hypothetical protein